MFDFNLTYAKYIKIDFSILIELKQTISILRIYYFIRKGNKEEKQDIL